jgi:hypothetical protein
MPVERRGWVIAFEIGSTGNGRNPIFNGRRQPSCGGTSRMTRECQVRICERLGVKFPGPTRQKETLAGGRVFANPPTSRFARWSPAYLTRLNTASAVPPAVGARFVYFSSSPVRVNDRFCSSPSAFGYVLASILKIKVLSLTEYVPE